MTRIRPNGHETTKAEAGRTFGLSAFGTRLFRTGSNLSSQYGVRAGIQIALAIANFVLIQGVARILDTTQFGLYSLVLTANGLVLVLCFQPITDGTNRFLREAIRDRHGAEFRRVIARLLLAAAALVSVLYGATLIVSTQFPLIDFDVTISALFVLLAYTLLSSFGVVAIAYFNVSAKYGWCFFVACGAPVASLMLIATVARFTPVDAFSVIAIQAAVWAVILGFVCFTRLPLMRAVAASLVRPASPSEIVFTAKFMKFAWSLPLLSLSGYALMYGDRIMVAKYFPLREVGQYSYMFVLTTGVVVGAFSVYGTATYLRAVERFAAVKSRDDLSRAVADHIRLSLIFPVSFLPLVVIYSLFDQQIVRFLFGQAASVPPGCLPLLLLSSALNYGSQQLSSVSLLMKYQQRFLAPRWVLIAFFFIGLSVYHPSLYSVSVFVLCINVIQFLITGIIVYRAQSNQDNFATLYT